MGHCPTCKEEVEHPEGDVVRMSEFFKEDAEEVDLSVQTHVQLTCPECESILGYLGVAAATGG